MMKSLREYELQMHRLVIAGVSNCLNATKLVNKFESTKTGIHNKYWKMDLPQIQE